MVRYGERVWMVMYGERGMGGNVWGEGYGW